MSAETTRALLAVLPSQLRDVVPSIAQTARQIENSAVAWISWALTNNPVIVRKMQYLSILRAQQNAFLHQDPVYVDLVDELSELQESYGYPTQQERERAHNIIEKIDAIRIQATANLMAKIQGIDRQIDTIKFVVLRNKHDLEDRLLPQVIRIMEREGVTDISSLSEYVAVVELTDLLESEINDFLLYEE